ncbi:hypothetical protein [uncultured Martelella sp.]|uniref:hypothetical protein n=1 Tax=uncultured Martelella sp. TaxID=392331 RepID=UPI0029C82267|nr:hypothetical protein [uncultured Martelella sp.]
MTRFDKFIDITPDHRRLYRDKPLPDWPVWSFMLPFLAGNIIADFRFYDFWLDAGITLAITAVAAIWQARILRRWQRRSIET